MTTNYEYGRNYEYAIKRRYEARGMYVIRSAASRGLFDLVAIGQTEIYLICCRRRKWTDKEINYILKSIKRPENTFILFFSKILRKERIYIYNNNNVALSE